MPDYNTRISELTDVLAETNQGIKRLQRELGTKVVRLKKADRPKDSESLFEEHKSLTETIGAAGDAIERMAAIDTRQHEIRDTMKKLREEHESLDKGLDPVFEQIGAVAFRLFKEHPLVDASYSSVFENLAKYYDGVRSIETELEQIGAGDDGTNRRFLEKIGLRSREFILRNRRSIKENQLPRLLTTAGQELAAGDFIESMEDEELNRVAQPLIDVRNRQSEIDSRLNDLSSESGRLVEEFNTVSGGRKLAPARRDRESQIDSARDRLAQVLLALGKLAENENIESLRTEIDAIRQEEARAAHFRSLLARLGAGREVIRVEREIDTLVARREKAAGQIRELEVHIAALEEEQRTRKAELAQYRSERGEEKELFES